MFSIYKSRAFNIRILLIYTLPSTINSTPDLKNDLLMVSLVSSITFTNSLLLLDYYEVNFRKFVLSGSIFFLISGKYDSIIFIDNFVSFTPSLSNREYFRSYVYILKGMKYFTSINS